MGCYIRAALYGRLLDGRELIVSKPISKIPTKVLRYFSLKPRIHRMFMRHETAIAIK